MATEVETRRGTCPSHGTVEATREMPGHGFPWAYHWVRRVIAGRKPFRCPTCGAAVTNG